MRLPERSRWLLAEVNQRHQFAHTVPCTPITPLEAFSTALHQPCVNADF